MLHRLRYAFNHPNFKKALSGEVEMDETYVGGKEKNRHMKKQTPGTSGGSGKSVVLGMIERKGNLIAEHALSRSGMFIRPMIDEYIKKGSMILTDEFYVYRYLWRQYQHKVVHHGVRQYVKGVAHTNTIECFWSHMKRGVDGIYHWVSDKHLQGYVDEYSLRFNTRTICTQDRFNLILGNVIGRLTYKDLINNGR
jgi:transposase-like protein